MRDRVRGYLQHVSMLRRWQADRAAHRRDRIENDRLRLLIALALRRDANCIDVGAHKGRILEQLVTHAPLGRHIAYEPIPRLGEDLAARFPQVEIRRAALSNVDGESAFVVARSFPELSGLRARSFPGESDIEMLSVRTERLDGHLPDDYVPTLIKIDVEGAEGLVIEGALETITRCRPIVIFEHGVLGGSDAYEATSADIFRMLCVEAGLRIFDFDGQGPYDLARFEGSYRRGDRWNYVAHY